MFPKFAAAYLALTALSGLAIFTVFAIGMPTALSGADLTLSSAEGDRARASAPGTGSDRPMWLLAASNIDWGRPHPTQPQHLELTFSETDEISVYWRLHKRHNMFLGRPCPVTTPSSIMDQFYWPGWYDSRQPVLPTEEASSILFFGLTILQARHNGEAIGLYNSCNREYSSVGRQNVMNWICANHSDLMRLWLVEVLADTQKEGRFQPEVDPENDDYDRLLRDFTF